jgi:hypothetical protein
MVNIVTFVLLKGVRFCFGEQCNKKNREEQGLLISFFWILHICALSREGEKHITEVAPIIQRHRGFVDRNVSAFYNGAHLKDCANFRMK